MQCPVCDSKMVTLTYERVSLTIEHLGNIYLGQVPVYRCYAGDHVTHQLPKRKEIYDLVTRTLVRTAKPLTPIEQAFLLGRLHNNNPIYSHKAVRSNIEYHSWISDQFELISPPNYMLNKLIIEKIKQSPDGQTLSPRKILCVDLVKNDIDELADDMDDCA